METNGLLIRQMTANWRNQLTMKFCGINSYLESHANMLQKLSINIVLSFHLQDKNHTYCYFCLTALTKSTISEHSSSKKDAIIFPT